MKQRCDNPKHKNYRNYGGRGISYCERWKEFANFSEDMGERPGPGYSLDRVNNEKGYEPGNCRWANSRQQGNNTRVTTLIKHRGEQITLSTLAQRYHINKYTLRSRIFDLGYSVDEAISKDRFSQPTGKQFSWNGESHSLGEWSKITGIPKPTLYSRIVETGMTFEDAITWPRYKHLKR